MGTYLSMLLRIHLHKEQRGPERRKWERGRQRSAGSSGRSSREDWWNHLGINEIKSLKTVPETHPEVCRLGRRGVVVGSVISGKDGKLGSSVAGHTLDRHLSHTESSHSHRHGFHWVFASFMRFREEAITAGIGQRQRKRVALRINAKNNRKREGR